MSKSSAQWGSIEEPKIHTYVKPAGFPADLMPDTIFPAEFKFTVKNIPTRYANALRRGFFEFPFYIFYLKGIHCTDVRIEHEKLQYQTLSLPILQDPKVYEKAFGLSLGKLNENLTTCEFYVTSAVGSKWVIARDMKPFCPCSSNIKLITCFSPPSEPITLRYGMVRASKSDVAAACLVNQVVCNPTREIKPEENGRYDYNFQIFYRSSISHIDLLKINIQYLLERLKKIEIEANLNNEKNQYIYRFVGETATIPGILSYAIYAEYPQIPYISYKIEETENPPCPYMNIRYEEGREALILLILKARDAAVAEWQQLLNSLG